MIYLLYGQPASGKTTLGKLLADRLDTPFIIDGDEFREMFSNDDYGESGRYRNIRNANAVATYLTKKTQGVGHVIMSLVNPYECLRGELRQNNERRVTEILLTSTRELRKEYHIEGFEAGNPDHSIDTDKKIEETWQNLGSMLNL